MKFVFSLWKISDMKTTVIICQSFIYLKKIISDNTYVSRIATELIMYRLIF